MQPEELRVREAAPQLGLLRPVADHDLGAGQIEREKRFEVLLDRDPPDADEDRARQVESDRALGPEQVGVDAAGPHAEIARSRAARSSVISDRVETIVTAAAAWKRRSTA